jgi:KamA family protein
VKLPIVGNTTIETTSPQIQTTLGAKLADLPHVRQLDPELRRQIEIVAAVLPFKINNYVLNELIDWAAVPDDPIFRLTFPNREMLPAHMYERVAQSLKSGEDLAVYRATIEGLRRELDPYLDDKPARNRPSDDVGPIEGLMHKYPDSVLFFPSQGQTCHAYCAYCYRWGQLVGSWDVKQQVKEIDRVLAYILKHGEISDVLLSGGDPMIMSAETLERYIDPLLGPQAAHVQTIRFCTKVLAYWPYRFTTDPDAAALLRLFERCVRSGRHISIMAHVSNVRELQTPVVVEAIRRLKGAGVVIRAQGPIIRGVNDSEEAWADMWRECVRLGIVPYYMYVERGTGAGTYFSVTLAKATHIYRNAVARMSGLTQTARGPVMATAMGKVVIDGIARAAGEDVFACRFLRARDPSIVGIPFFARYDESACWFDKLRPAFGQRNFFFETHE